MQSALSGNHEIKKFLQSKNKQKNMSSIKAMEAATVISVNFENPLKQSATS